MKNIRICYDETTKRKDINKENKKKKQKTRIKKGDLPLFIRNFPIHPASIFTRRWLSVFFKTLFRCTNS